jgi:hypothetical protein
MDEESKRKLDYASSPGEPAQTPTAPVVQVLGVVVVIAGLVVWFSGSRQITNGIVITGFGVTWWILGLVLGAIERRP